MLAIPNHKMVGDLTDNGSFHSSRQLAMLGKNLRTVVSMFLVLNESYRVMCYEHLPHIKSEQNRGVHVVGILLG